MLDDGFDYLGTFDHCMEEDIEACQPNATIPTRSIQHRLNSHYCTSYGKNTPECLPPGQEYNPPLKTQLQQNGDSGSYEPMEEYPEKSLKLQQEMQRDSNRQMDKLLRDIAPKTRR